MPSHSRLSFWMLESRRSNCWKCFSWRCPYQHFFLPWNQWRSFGDARLQKPIRHAGRRLGHRRVRVDNGRQNRNRIPSRASSRSQVHRWEGSGAAFGGIHPGSVLFKVAPLRSVMNASPAFAKTGGALSFPYDIFDTSHKLMLALSQPLQGTIGTSHVTALPIDIL